MSGLDIAELRRLHEAATAGEWFVRPSIGNDEDDERIGWACLDVVFNEDDVRAMGQEFLICEVQPYDLADHSGETLAANASLIAAMRNALPELLDAGERAIALEAEVTELRQRLLTAAGDDLCRLSQEELKAMTAGEVPIPPKSEFLASCERFHDQVAAKAGVNHDCLTLAQLVAENEALRGQIDDAREHLKTIVEVDGIDAGVIYLSNEGPTHPEVWRNQTVQVYDHKYFSPLGDALVALHSKLERTNDEVGTP